MSTTVASLNGLFKQAYGELKPLLPESTPILREVGPLTEAERVGDKYHQPAILSRELGYTLAGSDGTAYALNGTVSMTTQDAQLEGSEITLASQVAQRVATKSVGSAKAFKAGVGLVLKNNMASHATLREIDFLYGRATVGIGQSASMVNTSATTTTVTFSAATWAPGLWAGMENGKINMYRIDTGALLGGATTDHADSLLTVTTVDVENRAILFTGTSTATTALQGQAANTTFVRYGARGTTMTNDYNEPEGIHYVLNAAAGTTIWNISNNYSLWKPSVYSAGSAAFNFGKLISALNLPVGKAGLMGDVDAWVSIATFGSLVDTFSGARTLDSSYNESEGKNGVRKIKYVYGDSVATIRPHPMIMGGYGYLIASGLLAKVGSADIGTSIPGRSEDLFFVLQSNNGIGLRTYSDFSPFIKEPAKCVGVTAIVNP